MRLVNRFILFVMFSSVSFPSASFSQKFLKKFSEQVEKSGPPMNFQDLKNFQPSVQVPQFPNIQQSTIPKVNVQNIPRPQVNQQNIPPLQITRPQISIPGIANTPFDPATVNQTMRNLDKERRLLMDNQPMPGRDYTKIYLENKGVTHVNIWIATSKIPINGASDLGEGDNTVINFHQLKPGEGIHAANTPDSNFFLHFESPVSGLVTGNTTNFFNVGDKKLAFLEVDMGQRYENYIYQFGESKEFLDKLFRDRRESQQMAQNNSLQNGTAEQNMRNINNAPNSSNNIHNVNFERREPNNNLGSPNPQLAPPLFIPENGGKWNLPPNVKDTDVMYSEKLGIFYYPIKYVNGKFGATIVQVSQNSALAPIGFDPGDTIYALDDITFANLNELDVHFDRTKISFLNIRTNAYEARWVQLSPRQ